MAATEMERKFLSKEISYKSAWNFVGVISLIATWLMGRLWRTPSPYYFLVKRHGNRCPLLATVFVRPRTVPVPSASPPARRSYPILRMRCLPTHPPCARIPRSQIAPDTLPFPPLYLCPRSFPAVPSFGSHPEHHRQFETPDQP